jgi:hypothetical protein
VRASIAVIVVLITAGACGTAGPASSTPTVAGESLEPTPPAVTATPFVRPTLPGPPLTPMPGAPSSGITIKLTASSDTWSTNALTAPAGKTWKLDINNASTVTHTFLIEFGTSANPVVYKALETPPVSGFGFDPGDILPGAHSYDVPAFPAGTYTFICTIHPNLMVGTLTIK